MFSAHSTNASQNFMSNANLWKVFVLRLAHCFSNNNKSFTVTTQPCQFPTNVSVMQCIFGMLGAMKLALTSF